MVVEKVAAGNGRMDRQKCEVMCLCGLVKSVMEPERKAFERSIEIEKIYVG